MQREFKGRIRDQRSKYVLCPNSIRTKFGRREEIRRDENRRDEILAKTPKNMTTLETRKPTAIGALLAHRNPLVKPVACVSKSASGITKSWQEKAFRYAEKLGIVLTDKTKPRWLKAFKQASAGRKPENLERAYTFLVDHSKRSCMTQADMMRYFFWIYENGITNTFTKRRIV